MKVCGGAVRVNKVVSLLSIRVKSYDSVHTAKDVTTTIVQSKVKLS